jgi:protein-S-isoprenylcysteine O-methyltransferase Ste14
LVASFISNALYWDRRGCPCRGCPCRAHRVGDIRSRRRSRFAPPQKLVVTGLYRYVRNPIYIAVVAVIFGQALLFGDWRLLWYGALLWLFFHVWVVMIEEPTLKQTFGTEYESFRTNVPRWIPRLTPWRAA